MHRQCTRHIVRDLFEHATLSAREFKSVAREKSPYERLGGRDQRAGLDVEIGNRKRVSNARRGRFEALAAQREEELEAQELIENESLSSGERVGEVVGDVNTPERARAIEELQWLARLIGERIDDMDRSAKRLLNESANFPAGEAGLARSGIDRDDSTHLG